MFTSSLLTIGSLAMQFRTLLKRSPSELSEDLAAPHTVVPDGKKPPKFALIEGSQGSGVPHPSASAEGGDFVGGFSIRAQNLRAFPPVNSFRRPLSVPAIAPEILAAISATLAQQCGTYVPVRSVKKLASHPAPVSPWAQQGRVQVHSSHDLPGFVRQLTRSDGAA